jgi:hypothetical protein
MNTRTARSLVLGTALVVSVATVAACGPGEPAKDAPPSVVATPRDALLQAVPDASVGAYRFTIKGGTQPMSGVLDATEKTVRLDVSQHEPDAGFTLSMKFLVIDTEAWTKISFNPTGLAGLPKLPKKWMLLDPGKIKDKDDNPLAYGDETDPGCTATVFQNASNVKDAGSGHYTGTTDLTRQGDAGIVDDATLTALGEKARALPFTAVVDAKGYLTSTVVQVPAAGKAKAQTYAVSYAGYDATETPAVPAAGDQQKAVPAVYQMLNS